MEANARGEISAQNDYERDAIDEAFHRRIGEVFEGFEEKIILTNTDSQRAKAQDEFQENLKRLRRLRKIALEVIELTDEE